MYRLTNCLAHLGHLLNITSHHYKHTEVFSSKNIVLQVQIFSLYGQTELAFKAPGDFTGNGVEAPSLTMVLKTDRENSEYL